MISNLPCKSASVKFRVDVYCRRNFSLSVVRCGKVKKFSEIPGPFRLPVLGNLYLYKLGIYNPLKYHEVLKDLFKRYGPLVRQDIGMRSIVHVFDPESVRAVYEGEGKSPHVEPLQETVMMYRKQRNISLGLGNMNGDEWYRLRSAVQQMMLRPTEVHYYLPHISEVASDFVERIREKTKGNGELGNLREEVSKWSLESAGMVCFETRLGSLAGGESERQATKVVEANRKIFLLSSSLKFSLPLYKLFTTPKWKSLVEEEDYFYGFGGKYVDSTISKIKDLQDKNKMGDRTNHFLTYLLSKPELSYSDIKVITLSLFGDGLSTTTPTLICNLYCLATNPEVQERAFKEVSSVYNGGPVTIDMINKMPYLKAVIKETFRVYPNGTEISRIVHKDLILNGYLLPAGTHCNLNQSVQYKSKKYFKDPEKFWPDRWLRGESSGNIHPYLLIPFGIKARTCAGN
ncbi:probable cytochrome P450 CYP44 isoform X2 [Ischnura elegans]|uniref:probable cytochrome P450 CYP44 isoform X2 n=1 Tax=Ischnura elegans TaxID=197161 RepID=UPI001ED89E6F|nr:probable cytochrome P450 CYP44 isoform X2 [Ischnura elegans]